MYARVTNGQVTQVGLPATGEINGITVSGYDLLPFDVLQAEGWMQLVQDIPTYDEATQYVELTGYTVGESEVTANYTVLDKEPEPLTVEDRVTLVEETVGEILETIIPSIIGG